MDFLEDIETFDGRYKASSSHSFVNDEIINRHRVFLSYVLLGRIRYPEIKYLPAEPPSMSSRNLKAEGRLDFAQHFIKKMRPFVLQLVDSNSNSLLHNLFVMEDADQYKLDVFDLIIGLCREEEVLLSRDCNTVQLYSDEETNLVKLLSIQNEFGQTPLHTMFGDYEDESLLLAIMIALNDEKLPAKTINPFLITDHDEETPLHYAPHGGPELLRLLLEFNWNDSFSDSSKAVIMKDASGALPLHHAISACMTEIETENMIPSIIQERLHGNEYILFAEIVDYVNENGLDCSFGQELLGLFESLWEVLVVILSAMCEVMDIKTNLSSPVHGLTCMPFIPASILKMVHLFDTVENLSYDENGQLPIHVAASAPQNQSLSLSVDLAPLWQSELEPRSIIEYLLERDPTVATRVVLSTGQLPLHLAIKSGKNMYKDIFSLIRVAPHSISERDPVTMLYPSLLAAAKIQSRNVENLDLIYRLLILDPSILFV